MTKHFLLSTAVAALIAGTGFAYAQGTGMGREGGSGSSMQQNTPSTEQGRGSATTQMRNGASNSGMSNEGTNRGNESRHHAQDTNHGKMKNERSAEDYGKSGEHSKSMRSERNESGKSEKNMRAEEHKGKSEERNQRTEERNGRAMDHNRNAEERNGRTMDHRNAEERNGMKSDSSKSAVDTNRSSRTTTGQAGAGAKLSTEQRTKITSVIRNEHVQPTTNVNFSIAVGTRVPRTVSFHPLPTEIVDIYPSWRGYEFFLVRDQIVVVDPTTMEIVAVLEA
jgi:hypothetical protein